MGEKQKKKKEKCGAERREGRNKGGEEKIEEEIKKG